jgi:VWFA-related protein
MLVTVVDQRTGRPVEGLRASDFTVLEDNRPRAVEAVETPTGLLDIMLLLDASLLGSSVQPLAENLIGQLREGEQMAVVAMHESADLVQDFTSSRELLLAAVGSSPRGGSPRILDAIYAAMDSGFRAAGFRRAVLVLTAGVEGPSRVGERDVVRLARRNGVSVYAVYVFGHARDTFERLARATGGAHFPLRDSRSGPEQQTAARIFEVLRSQYILALSGNLALGERVKVEVKRPGKLFVSGLPLD